MAFQLVLSTLLLLDAIFAITTTVVEIFTDNASIRNAVLIGGAVAVGLAVMGAAADWFKNLNAWIKSRWRKQAVPRELGSYRRTAEGELFGREVELQELCSTVRRSRLGIIIGGPGEGKSELASVAAATLHSELRFTKAFSVDLEGPIWKELKDKASALQELAKRFELASWREVLLLQPTPVVLYHNTEDILMDSDGAAAKAFSELLRTLHSVTEGIKIFGVTFFSRPRAYQLITSRIAPAADLLPQHAPNPVLLKRLEIGAACELLNHKCLQKGVQAIRSSEAKTIVGICEGNSLLLQLLGGFLAEGEVTAQEIIDSGIRANQCRGSVHKQVDKVGAFLSLLLKRHQPKQLDWLAEMSLWDSFTEEQATGSTAAAAAAAGSTVAELATPRLLQHMARMAILECKGLAPHERYSMHVLVREAAAQLLKDRGNAQERFVRAMAAVGNHAPAADAGNLRAARAALNPELGNCRRLCSVPAALVEDLGIMGGLSRFQSLLMDCGFFLEACSFAQQIYNVHESELGIEHPATLASMNTLGTALFKQGKFADAEELQRVVLANFRSTLGNRNQRTVNAMTDLALNVSHRGSNKESEELFREALDVNRAVLGDTHQVTLANLGNLGGALRNLERYADAEKLHREALAGCRSKWGEEHASTLASKNNLGITLRFLGNYAAAEALQSKVLAVRRSVLGDVHASTLASMEALCATLHAQRKYPDTMELHREWLAGCQSTLGDGHPYTMACLVQGGQTLHAQRRFAEAEVLYREVVEEYQSTPALGDSHDFTRKAKRDLAGTLQAMGKHAEAQKLLFEASPCP